MLAATPHVIGSTVTTSQHLGCLSEKVCQKSQSLPSTTKLFALNRNYPSKTAVAHATVAPQSYMMGDPGFPIDIQEFDSDDRISFSKLDNKFIAVHHDGSEYEFDADLKKWVLPADDNELQDHDVHSYGGQLSTEAPDEAASKKRKNGSDGTDQVSSSQVCRPTCADSSQ